MAIANNKKKKMLVLMGITATAGGAAAISSHSSILELKNNSILELNELLQNKKLIAGDVDIKSVIKNNGWKGSPLANFLKSQKLHATDVYASNSAAKPKYLKEFKTHDDLYTLGKIKTMRFSIPFNPMNGGSEAMLNIDALNVLNGLNQFVSYNFKGLYVNETKVSSNFNDSIQANKIIQNGELGNWNQLIKYSDIATKNPLFNSGTNVDAVGKIEKVEIEIELDNPDFVKDVVIDQGNYDDKKRSILVKTEDDLAFTLDSPKSKWGREESIFSQKGEDSRLSRGELNWKPINQAGKLFIDDAPVENGYVRVYKDNFNSKWNTRAVINSSKITNVISGILPQEKLLDFNENDIQNIVNTKINPPLFDKIDFRDAVSNFEYSIIGNDGLGVMKIKDDRLRGFAEITSPTTKKVYYRDIKDINTLKSKDSVKLYLSPKSNFLFNNGMNSFIKEVKIRDLDSVFNKSDVELDIVSHFNSSFISENSLEKMGNISEIRLNKLGLNEHTKIWGIKVLDSFNNEISYSVKDIRNLNSIDKNEAEHILQSSRRDRYISIDQDPKNFNKDFGLTLKLLNTTQVSSIQIFRDSLNPINISLKNDENIRYTANSFNDTTANSPKEETWPNDITGHKKKRFYKKYGSLTKWSVGGGTNFSQTFTGRQWLGLSLKGLRLNWQKLYNRSGAYVIADDLKFVQENTKKEYKLTEKKYFVPQGRRHGGGSYLAKFDEKEYANIQKFFAANPNEKFTLKAHYKIGMSAYSGSSSWVELEFNGSLDAQGSPHVWGNSRMHWDVFNDDAVIERTGGLDSFGEITDMWMNFYPSHSSKGLTLTELKYYGSQANPEESWTEFNKKAKYTQLNDRKKHFKIENFEALTDALQLSKYARLSEYNNRKVAEDILYNNTELDGTKSSHNGWWPLWFYDRKNDPSKAFLTSHISVWDENMRPGMKLSTIGFWGELWNVGRNGEMLDLIIKTKDNRIFKLIRGQEWYQKSKVRDLNSVFLSTTKKYKWVELFANPGTILAPIKNVWGNNYVKNLKNPEKLIWEFRFEGEHIWRELSNYVFHQYNRRIYLRAHRKGVLVNEKNHQILREKLFDDGSKYSKEFEVNFAKITGISKQIKINPVEMQLKDKIHFSGTNGRGILEGINSLKEKYDIQYIVERNGSKKTYDSAPIGLRNGDKITLILKPKSGSEIVFVDSNGKILKDQNFKVSLNEINNLVEPRLTHLKSIPAGQFGIFGSDFHGHFANDLHDKLINNTYDSYFYVTRNGKRELISINVLPTNLRNDDILEIVAVVKDGYYFVDNNQKRLFKKTIFKKKIENLIKPKEITNTNVSNDFIEEKNQNGFKLSKKSIQDIKNILKQSSLKIVVRGKDGRVEDITNTYETHTFQDGDIISLTLNAKDGFYFKGNLDPNKLIKTIVVSKNNMNLKKIVEKIDPPSNKVDLLGINGEGRLSFENKWVRQLYQKGIDFWFIINGKKMNKNELPKNLKNGQKVEIIISINDKNHYSWIDGSSNDIKHSFEVVGLRDNHNVKNPNVRVYERTNRNWRNAITGPSGHVRMIPGIEGSEKSDKINSKIIHKHSLEEIKNTSTISITAKTFSFNTANKSDFFAKNNAEILYNALAQVYFKNPAQYARLKNLMPGLMPSLQNIPIDQIKQAIKKNGYWEVKTDSSLFTWDKFKLIAKELNLQFPNEAKTRKYYESRKDIGYSIRINSFDLTTKLPKIDLSIRLNDGYGYNDILAISDLKVALKNKKNEEIYSDSWDKILSWDSTERLTPNGRTPSFWAPDGRKRKVEIKQNNVISGHDSTLIPSSALTQIDFNGRNFILEKKSLFGNIDDKFSNMKNGDWVAIGAESSDASTRSINRKSWFVQMKHIHSLLKEIPLTDFPSTADKMLVRGSNSQGYIVNSLWNLSRVNVKINFNGKVYTSLDDPALIHLKNGDDLTIEITPKKGFAFFGQDGIPLLKQMKTIHKTIKGLKSKVKGIDPAKINENFVDIPKLISKLKTSVHYNMNNQTYSLELSFEDVIKDLKNLTPEQQKFLKDISFFVGYKGKRIKMSILELIKGSKTTINDVKPGNSISIIAMPNSNSQFISKNGVLRKKVIKEIMLKKEYFPSVLAQEPEFKIRSIGIAGAEGKGRLSGQSEFNRIVNDKRVLRRYIITNSKSEYDNLFETINGIKVLKSNIDPKRWVDKLPTNLKNGQFILAKIFINPNYKAPSGQKQFMIGESNPAKDFILITEEVSNLIKEISTPDPSLVRDSNPVFNNSGLTVVKTTNNPNNYLDEVKLKVSDNFIKAINKLILANKDFKFELLLKKYNKRNGTETTEKLEVIYNSDGTIKDIKINHIKLDNSDDMLSLSIKSLSNHGFNIEKQFNASATKEDFVDQLNYKSVSIKDIKINNKAIIPILDVPRDEVFKTKARLSSPFYGKQVVKIENIKKMILAMIEKYIDEHGVSKTNAPSVNLIIIDKNGKQKYKKLDIFKAIKFINQSEEELTLKIDELLNASIPGSHLETGDKIELEMVLPPTDKREFKYFDNNGDIQHSKVFKFDLTIVGIDDKESDAIPDLLRTLPQPHLPRKLIFKNVNNKFNGQGILDDNLSPLWIKRPHQKLYFIIKDTGADPASNDAGWRPISELSKSHKWHNGERIFLKLVADDGFAFESSQGGLFEKIIVTKLRADSLHSAIKVPNLKESKAFDWSHAFTQFPGHQILNKNNPLENSFSSSEREKVSFEWRITHADGSTEIIKGDDIYKKKFINGDKLEWRVLLKKKYLQDRKNPWVIFKTIDDGLGNQKVAEISGGATNWGDNAKVIVPKSDILIDEIPRGVFNKLNFKFILDKNGNHFKFAQNPFDLIPLNTSEKSQIYLEIEFIGLDGKKHVVKVNWGESLEDINQKISISGVRSKSDVTIRVITQKGVSFLKKGTTLLKKQLEFKVHPFDHIVKTKPIIINGFKKIPVLKILGIDGEGKISPEVMKQLKAIYDKAIQNGLNFSLAFKGVDGSSKNITNDWDKIVDFLNKKGLKNGDNITISIDIGQAISKSFSIDGGSPQERFSKDFSIRGLKHLINIDEKNVDIKIPKDGVSGLSKGNIELTGIDKNIREKFNIKIYKIILRNGREIKQEILDWDKGINLNNGETIQVELIAKNGNVFRVNGKIETTLIKKIKIKNLKRAILVPPFPKNLIITKKADKFVDVNFGDSKNSDIVIFAILKNGNTEQFKSKQSFLDALNNGILNVSEIEKLKYKLVPKDKNNSLVDSNDNILGSEANSNEFVLGGNIHAPNQEKLDNSRGAVTFNKTTLNSSLNLLKVFQSMDPNHPYTNFKIRIMRRSSKDDEWKEMTEVLPSDFKNDILLEPGYEYKFVPVYIESTDKNKFFISDANDDGIFKINLLNKIKLLDKPIISKLIIVGEKNKKRIINDKIIKGIDNDKIAYVRYYVNGRLVNLKDLRGLKNGDVITVEVFLKKGNIFKINSTTKFSKNIKISGIKQEIDTKQYIEFPRISVFLSISIISTLGGIAVVVKNIFKKREKSKEKDKKGQ